ncbi:MAG: YebC/PmpR family DNA-binding transcriptional regulator [Bacteroidales bacterium]|nr:YebC/PmpR family DNA-binding transcriptional regulator [Bacteroidales bacterium]
MKAAVKVSGPNVDANPRLKAAIDKAYLNNMTKEAVLRNIQGSSKDASELVSLEYECYGPNGIQIIVNALSDNSNRTYSNLRGYLSKLHGEIAKPNSVKIFFEMQGVIIFEKHPNQSKESIEEIIIENNIEGYVDTNEFEDSFEVITTPDNNFYLIKDLLSNSGYKVFEAEIKLVSQNKITSLDEENKARLEKFIESCDEDEDIQSVVTNYEEN